MATYQTRAPYPTHALLMIQIHGGLKLKWRCLSRQGNKERLQRQSQGWGPCAGRKEEPLPERRPGKTFGTDLKGPPTSFETGRQEKVKNSACRGSCPPRLLDCRQPMKYFLQADEWKIWGELAGQTTGPPATNCMRDRQRKTYWIENVSWKNLI